MPTPNLSQDAIAIAFYNAYSQAAALKWLVDREAITDPAHELNTNPALTLMVLNKWLNAPSENNDAHPDAPRWIEQAVLRCLSWKWPANSTMTALYYRLGQLCSTNPSRLDFIRAWPLNDPRARLLLEGCKHLEDAVRPNLSASIAYGLEDDGVPLVDPQDLLQAAFHWVQEYDPSVADKVLWDGTCEYFWMTDRVQNNPDDAALLAKRAPQTMTMAICRGLYRNKNRNINFQGIPPAAATIFAMDPAQSSAAQWLDLLIPIQHVVQDPSRVHPRAPLVWEALQRTFPEITALLQIALALEGPLALSNVHPYRQQLEGHMQAILQKQAPALDVGVVFDSSI